MHACTYIRAAEAAIKYWLDMGKGQLKMDKIMKTIF